MQLLETTVTQFELRQRPSRHQHAPDIRRRLLLQDVPRIPLSYYSYLYQVVGRAHHWTSRLLPAKQLAHEIHVDGIAVHVLSVDGAPAGWFELDWARKPGETRLVHFGMLPDFRGLGLARYLLSEAIFAGFAVGNPVMTLETNTLDHPAARRLYVEAGFVPVSHKTVSTRAIEA
ncbi:N-acetyltransferase [Aureimonas sp. SA4125]|uniref:GNAT family N-acetyltransferase n=1 Tax=Aureimonas sp. SA4125 TaxID=2826993 RepID=UPI001CC39117|nr:GNAT family N-acetyltransferase [Aureimonas sp. SA4125]BDA83720.1 N-acetyltransferase [Aureimonas sp. SA4125]